MKNIGILIFAIALVSCVKQKTCTCKNDAGAVKYTETIKTNSKESIEAFEKRCNAESYKTYTNGVLTSEIPCVIQ